MQQAGLLNPQIVHAEEVSVAAAQDYLAKLDLVYIVEYMTSERYPLPRWTEDEAIRCVQQYKNFLLLIKKIKVSFWFRRAMLMKYGITMFYIPKNISMIVSIFLVIICIMIRPCQEMIRKH
ncbi:MAG: hypothetical protein HWD59_05945 [Coxiellaceae bacterium]|nr:MAG: hypothetical protein HWD59_05945 [Coxiellaceae bacterium]